MSNSYVGLDEDRYGGMTLLGRVVRDARVFGIIPEDEICAGWAQGQMQTLMDKVDAAWDQYGHLPSRLPEDLRERHARIHDEAIRIAREQGWSSELGEDD